MALIATGALLPAAAVMASGFVIALVLLACAPGERLVAGRHDPRRNARAGSVAGCAVALTGGVVLMLGDGPLLGRVLVTAGVAQALGCALTLVSLRRRDAPA